LDRGLFYQYEDRTEDCSTIKGKVDYRDYFTNKYRTDKQHLFQCTFSTFEFDNSLNRIIKFVCKKLLNDTTNTANKKMLRHILMKLNEVSDVRCAPHDCDSVRLTRFHQRYRIVLSMSKMFLLNQTSTYAVDDTEAFCFLFPTEVLFEGFVGGFLQSILQEKANVTLQASDTSLIEDIIINDTSYGSAFTLRNDIYVQMEHGKCFVLDTKYKQVDRIENSKESAAAIQRQVSIDDLRQIREYAHRRGLKEGYLLYPVYRFEDLEHPPKVLLKGYIIVDGEKHYIDVYIIRIPFVFEEDVEQTKTSLSKILSGIFYE
jgi:5-methylcytosine-specific restriction endonuclease McrBC regulatory subunit McrC